MAHAGPSRPNPTEPMSNTASPTSTIDMVELHEDLTKLHRYSAEDFSDVFQTMRKNEQEREKMERRFDDRCDEIEDLIVKALEALIDKEQSVVSASSNALKQPFASLLRHGEKLSAVPKMMTQARLATLLNGPTRLLSRDYTPFLTKLHTIRTTLRTHWEASQHLDSTMTVAYPWLSFAMASCYYVALTALFVESACSIYSWYIMIIYFGRDRTVSILILGVISGCAHRIVPYTLGLGKPFATLVVMLLWAVAYAMFGA